MKINQLLVVSGLSVLIGGGGFLTSKALAEGFLTAQNATPSTEQRQPGEGRRGGGKFNRLSGITEAQRTQLQQIHTASHQQIDAIPTAEQKARMEAIRSDARTKMEALLTAEQRQQLAQSAPSNGEGKGRGFPRVSGLTDAQRTQMREIRTATRQQMDAVLTAEQKARMEAIRSDARTKMEALLTAEQRQQLAQSAPSNGEGKGRGFPRVSGLTDAQRTQMREIRTATRQQMDAVLTAEQKAQIEAIRNDTKTKMDAVLTAEQRQELEQLRQRKQQNRSQQQS